MADGPDQPRRRGVVVPLAVAGVAAVVALVMVIPPMLSDPEPASAPATSPSTAPPVETTTPSPRAKRSAKPDDVVNQLAKLARRKPGDPLAIGPVDAPVVMVTYSDFQCPFCGRYARKTHPVLVEKFVKKGILRIEWRDFPYLGEESGRAAKAARAAGRQGKFWEYHDALYHDQPSVNSGTWTEDSLVTVARDLGLDTERFRRDMHSTAIAKAIQRDFTEGQSIGVTGTPAALINGVPVLGALPTSTFADQIKRAAAEAR